MATYVYGDYKSWTQINVYFRAWFAYTVSSTDTTYSITVYAGPQLSGNTGTVKCSLSCKLTATGQSARSTTKTFSTDSDDSSKRMTFLSSKKLTWNKTSSEQSITIQATVDRSNMTASTASKKFTIPALASYNISYNSNSGSGSISTQKKYYGKSLTLSNGSGFTRSGYTLKGWNTASNGTGTAYELGQTYTSNKALTLYAQWSTDYSITDVRANRVDEVRNELSRSEYIYISFSYNTLSTTGVSYSITVNGNTIESGSLSSTTGTIEHFSTDETYSLDETHSIVINVGGITKTITVPIAARPIDIMGNGNDISMGIMSPADPDYPLMLTPNCSISSDGNIEAAGEVTGATSKTVITTFSSGWDVYSTDPAAPVTLRRCGKFVDLTGMIRNTTAVTLNATQVTIFTIPEGYRPSQTMTILSQGSTTNVFVIRIKASGEVTFERYRSTSSTSTSYSSISEGGWFPIHAAWIMD